MTINDMLLGKWFRASASNFMALLPAASLAGEPAAVADPDDMPPDVLTGYTEHRTDLPGGRHANIKTGRAVVVKADGTGRRVQARRPHAAPGRPDGPAVGIAAVISRVNSLARHQRRREAPSTSGLDHAWRWRPGRMLTAGRMNFIVANRFLILFGL